MAKDNTGVKPLKDGISIKAVDVFFRGGLVVFMFFQRKLMPGILSHLVCIINQ